MITTVEQAVKELGGTGAVARLVNTSLPAVSNAKKRNQFPHAWRLRIYQIAQDRGIEISPDLLGIDAPSDDEATA